MSRFLMSGEEFFRRTKLRGVLDLPEMVMEIVIEVGKSVRYTVKAEAQSKEPDEHIEEKNE